MASTNVALIERIDVHKSCKALENIVNIFNDYCQVAEALALEQKKLARALKEAVGLKATNELAGNALSAAASVLESLAEVDAKFVKTADKECDSASNELKKWFKKLAKDEKAHDERISTANAKIKQAGQQYEKKAKKKDRDAAEEHSRYVNLLSAVGPEMSQDKYNHALFVTQKHTLAVYSVASSILRTANAEWSRACECVRRFAPMIGNLGECRAYLEGGWMASMPEVAKAQELPEHIANEPMRETVQGLATPNRIADEMGMRVRTPGTEESSAPQSLQPLHSPPASVGSATANSSASSSQIPSHPQVDSSSRNQQGMPPSAYHNAMSAKLNTDSVRSIESLSSFPSPPTHFPLPDMARIPSSLSQSMTIDEFGATLTHSSPEASDSLGYPTNQPGRTTNASFGLSTPALTDESGRSPPMYITEPRTPSAPQDADVDSRRETETIKIKPQDLEPVVIQNGSSSPVEAPAQVRRVSGAIERSDSALSSNSIVASMRDKWSRAEPAPPSPTKERGIPRVPNKVFELANRYKPTIDTAAPLSPRPTGPSSPTLERSRQVSDPQALRDLTQNQQLQRANDTKANGETSSGGVTAPSPSEMDIMRRRRRLDELEDLERREQTQALREREREIEQRAKEIEQERGRLRALASASGTSPTSVSMSARPRYSSDAAAAVRPHSQHSYSMTSLVAPRGGPGGATDRELLLQRPLSQHGDPSPRLDLAPSISASYSSSSSTSNAPQPQLQPRPDHAPYCGCYTCSAAQYGGGGNAQARGTGQMPPPQLQARPDKEKPKGWMRRLSMPVVSNAFSSSDSKKAFGPGAGIAGGRAGAGFSPSNVSFPRFEPDHTGGIGNISRPRKLSFGRR